VFGEVSVELTYKGPFGLAYFRAYAKQLMQINKH